MSIFAWAVFLSFVILAFFSSADGIITSPSSVLFVGILLKKSSLILSNPAILPKVTFVLVAMTYAWLTLLRGTPLSLYGPVTNKSPDFSCLRKTTLLPLNLPDKIISTVPAVIVALSLVAFGVLHFLVMTFLV